MRGFWELNSVRAIMKGYEIYYNFCRKHQALNKYSYGLATDLNLRKNILSPQTPKTLQLIFFHQLYKLKSIILNMAEQPQEIVRVKLPRGKEVLGIIEQRVGASRMLVKCTDGKSRNCRVPGRLRRRLWLREGNVVIVKPWEFDDGKGDVLFKYNPAQVQWLRGRGYLKTMEDEF
jgi:translation initiation factor 1A